VNHGTFMAIMKIHVHSRHSCHLMSLGAFHVIHANSCYSCKFMLFMQIHVIHANSCYSCQFMSFKSFISIQVIHLNSSHSSQFMSFISIHVIHLNSGHPRFLSFNFFWKFSKVGGEGKGGQICLPKPSATALLSGRRQKVHILNNIYF
jgi:hypothetical protein